MAWDRVCTLVGAISRTVIHKTITTCVAISTAVFKIGLHCEDKAVENGEAGPVVWRNISQVETFRPIRRNGSFRNPHRISCSSMFYVFVYYVFTIVNVCIHIINVISIRFGNDYTNWYACLSIMLGFFDNDLFVRWLLATGEPCSFTGFNYPIWCVHLTFCVLKHLLACHGRLCFI